jgi:lantibiotic modifying enzyme
MLRCDAAPVEQMAADLDRALDSAERNWPGNVDHLCCGSLGTVEFLRESAVALGRTGLRDLASSRLAQIVDGAASRGDFRWSTGQRRFNLGLFRGLAGVGYSTLREINPALPNVLVWQ